MFQRNLGPKGELVRGTDMEFPNNEPTINYGLQECQHHNLVINEIYTAMLEFTTGGSTTIITVETKEALSGRTSLSNQLVYLLFRLFGFLNAI